MSHRQKYRASGAAAAGVVAALLVVAGWHASRSPATPAPATPITASERDFAISLPHVVNAGPVDIQVSNHGPDQHELIGVRASSAASLPLRGDGLTVDEEALARREVGSLEPGKSGGVRDLHVVLRPGRYVFFCNMAGHFMAGMHAVVVVR